MLPALVVILAVAAGLYSWHLGASGLSTYYASAARSMSRSLHALLFGALDPAATTTLDKLSGFVVPQAIAVRLFGFHAWALDLPQVIEGVLTVFTGYVIGTRWRGHVAGLATAGILAVTPMLAAMFGRPMEDGMLTMTMVFAFAAWQRAVLSRHWAWLLLSGAWVAVGFQAKMLQSWLILPALAIGYLVAAGGPLRTRMLRVGIAGAVTVLLSLGWITAMQLTPAQDRPYIDGSTNDNAYSMVFGYNGIDRIVPGLVPGAVPQLGAHGGQSTENRTATSSAGYSVAKLVLPQFTGQIGWLYPAAIAGVVLGLLRGRRDRRAFGTVVALATWIAVTAAVLSAAFVPHATYFATIALPIALLAVSGVIDAHRMSRRSTPHARVPLLVLVAVQAAWCATIALTAAASLHWIAIPVVVLGAAGVAGLAARPGSRGWLAPAIAAALLGPLVVSSLVLGPGGGGSASDAFAGPRPGQVVRAAVSRTHVGYPQLDPDQLRLLHYIVPRNRGRRWLFATDTMAIAVSFALYSPYQVTPMGGFSRQAPTPALAQLRSDVRQSVVRYVLLDDSAGPPNTALREIRDWVPAHCGQVLHGRFRSGSAAVQTLYDCAPADPVALGS